jgi:hypothetical protein
MTAFDPDRMRQLVQDRAQLAQSLHQAQTAVSSLTLEHNDYIRKADQAATAGAKQRAREQAGRKGEELKKARRRAEELSSALERKEIEITDMIAALWAASQPLLSADTVRQLNEHLGETNRRLRNIEEGITPIGPALAGLAGAFRDLRQQSVALRPLAASPGQRDAPVVQMGWRPGAPGDTDPRSSQLSGEDIAKLPGRVTVLLFASEPRDLERPDLDREIREITEKVTTAKFGGRIDLRPWPAAEPLDLIPNMNRHKPHMVQFSGHGTPDGLLMMGPRDRSAPLAADRLINMLKWAGEDLRIVFFNICDSEQHARAAARIVDAAIGMRGRMHDGPARMFAAHLYSALASGISLKRGFHQACAAIDDEPDSAIPQLFFRNGSDPHKVVLVRPDSP